jgi:MFS family permease
MAIALAALPLSPTVGAMAVAYCLAIAFQSAIGAMVSGLVATEVPVERRSATLNLIYLPLYLGGIAGPALGATVVSNGLRTVFFLAAGVLAVGTVMAFLFARRHAAAASGRLAAVRVESAD